MVQTIKQRDYIFKARPRRSRPALALLALGVLSMAAVGATRTNDTVAKVGPTQAEAAQVYGAIGGPERFVLETNGDAASIRFLCLPSKADCFDGAPVALEADVDGETKVLRDTSGNPVVTIAARSVRLHAGSDAVPGSVPAEGRAVLPTNAQA